MASSPRVGQISRQDKIRQLMGQYGIGFVLVIMMVVIAIMEPRFMTVGNIINVATQISINGLLCFGLCIAITNGLPSFLWWRESRSRHFSVLSMAC